MKIYTLKEAADFLHMSERTAYDLVHTGELKAAKIGGKYIIKEEWIDDLIMSTAEKAG